MLGPHGFRVGLGEDRPDKRGDEARHGLRDAGQQVAREVGAAALPGGAGESCGDCLFEALTGVRGDELDAGESAADQAAQESQPAPSSVVRTSLPRTSRCPSLLTAVPTTTAALTTRPPSRHLTARASSHRDRYGPLCNGRHRKASTAASSVLAISGTCDLEIPDNPMAWTS